MKRLTAKIVTIGALATFLGCMTFTQEDYDRQQKRYERDRQIQEQKAKESVYLRW